MITSPERTSTQLPDRESRLEVVEVGGALQIVRTEGAETRGQRLVRRLRNTATGRAVAGMSTDEIMALLRGE